MNLFVFAENEQFTFQYSDVFKAGFDMDNQGFRLDPSTIVLAECFHVFFRFWHKITEN